jgi:16S rRNA (cytosine967-C5)-methyltransferase
MIPDKLQAIQILCKVLDGRSLSGLLGQQAPIVKEYCFGVCRWYDQLDANVQQLLQKPLKDKDDDIHVLLLIGLYQLIHMRTPDHAAINDSVDMTKKLKKLWATKLVNACLRRFLREKDTLLANMSEEGQFAHPDWIIARVKKAWPNDWQRILEANNTQAPMTLRANTAKVSAKEYAARIPESTTSTADTVVQLNKPINALELPGFHEGLVSVQDEASQYVAPLFDLSPGMKVLDACSAPGGKTCHLLERFPEIKLTALDISPGRLEKVQQNLDRLQLKATLIAADASRLNNWWNQEPFDAILIDAPCSATGVIRRHPDIKLLRYDEDIASLAVQQQLLLCSLWKALKPGGQCVYTTCSIFPDENDETIKQFLSTHDDATINPATLPIGQATELGWQAFPQINGHDGFYYCRLLKQS